MERTRKISIIILTWNGLEYTKLCLESLFDNTVHDHFTVYVVDNGSTDGTLEYLRGRNDIELIENGQNLGFVRGNNVAIDLIKDGDIVLLNNDIIIEQPDWLEELEKTAYENERTGLVGCRLVNEKGEFLHAGTFIFPETYWGQQIGGGQKDVGQYSDNRVVQGVVFACTYIKREVLETVGGLNEAFFSYFEDTDYCLRVIQAGYDCVCCGKVTLIHYQNVSTSINKVNFNDMFLKSQKTFKGIWDKQLKSRYKKKMAWNSIVNFPSGYAVSAKNFMLALDSKGVDIRYKYVYGPGTPFVKEEPEMSDNYIINVIRGREFDDNIPQVVYGQGDVFCRNTGKYKIGYTMLETTGIPDEWVRQANMMDEVWVPSNFNVKTFRDSGVTVPIYVMPLGVDTNFFNENIHSQKKHNKYTFLSIFEWGERKAPEVLLKAYFDAFTKDDDVLLICKIFNNDGSIDVKSEIDKMNLPEDGPEVLILYNQIIEDYQMPILYRSADCFVLPTRGEGWGMPILEAMACGIPALATRWSSQVDFMTEENSYFIETDGLVDAVAKCPYYEGFQWANPSLSDLSRKMRYIFEHQEEAKLKGKQAAQDVKDKWSWEKVSENMLKRLNEIGE